MEFFLYQLYFNKILKKWTKKYKRISNKKEKKEEEFGNHLRTFFSNGLVSSVQFSSVQFNCSVVTNSLRVKGTFKGNVQGTLLPPSDAYVRSFLYLLYTLIKLYYTKALSDPASSLAPD